MKSRLGLDADVNRLPGDCAPELGGLGTEAERADRAVCDVLRAHYDGVPALIVPSPPGAGKTDLVEKVAAQEGGTRRRRCVIVTQTNQQAFELMMRLRAHYSVLPIALYCRHSLVLPDQMVRSAMLQIVHEPRQLPTGPCVVVANAMKLALSAVPIASFDLMIVDEAWQLANHLFLAIAGLAKRVMLVGDPGQIAPVITADTTRWQANLAGPHVPAPQALLATHPGTAVIGLPVSRRLVDDSAEIVQRAFYPNLPFTALERSTDRRVEFRTLAATHQLDGALRGIERGQTLSMVELPQAAPITTDAEIAAVIARVVDRFVIRGANVVTRDGAHRVDGRRIGVVCAHRSQVRAVRARLTPAISSEVLVETANRFQGLERDITVVWHPLAGHPRVRDFHVDAGRFCVMLSRHRVACVVVGRAGIMEVLDRYAPGDPPVLGVDTDPEFDGWFAHREILEHLINSNRVFPLARRATT